MSEIPQLVERILELRGISAEEVDEFLSPSIRDLAPPCELPNVDAAAETILAAVRAKRKIVVFGDYDCDGVCATAILVRALSAFGADVSAFLPERLSEGYGMSEASVSRMLKENPGVGLVVTVDNGINSVENVAFLKEKGVDVVVTDHHLPGDTLPDCVVVNPKVSHPEIFENLCGAGVAFLLANELVTKARAQGLYSGEEAEMQRRFVRKGYDNVLMSGPRIVHLEGESAKNGKSSQFLRDTLRQQKSEYIYFKLTEPAWKYRLYRLVHPVLRQTLWLNPNASLSDKWQLFKQLFVRIDEC